MPGQLTREKQASADVFIGPVSWSTRPSSGHWYEANQLNDLVFLDFEPAADYAVGSGARISASHGAAPH